MTDNAVRFAVLAGLAACFTAFAPAVSADRGRALPARYRTVVVTLRDGSYSRVHSVICDSDVRAVIRSLAGAGATSIQFNGMPVGPGARIRAAGPVLVCEDRSVALPYRITAVGAKDRLVRALRAVKRALRFSDSSMLTFR